MRIQGDTETNSQFVPENGPKTPQKETRKSSKHQFPGASYVSFRECKLCKLCKFFEEVMRSGNSDEIYAR